VRRRRAARELIAKRLHAGCADCGTKEVAVLEFDHIGEKSGHVSTMGWEGYAAKRLTKELDACEVVCVNCHRLRTYSRMERCWRSDPGSLETAPGLSDAARRNMIVLRGLLTIHPCVDCGETDIRVLEFDHRRDKRGNVTKLARDECGIETLRAEVAKCEIRCGNCHRRRTRSERSVALAS
jgi:hypothetical protein